MLGKRGREKEKCLEIWSHSLLKLLFYFLIFLFLSNNFFKILKEKNDYSLFFKKEAVKYVIENVGKEKFRLAVFGQEDYKYGLRYLFYYYGKEPEESPVDQDYQHFYKAKKEKVSKIAVFSFTDFDPEFNRLCKSLKIRTFGQIKTCVSN